VEGVIGGSEGTASFEIDFPTSASDFWAIIDDREGYAHCRAVCCWLNEQVEDVEGFPIVINTYGYAGGNWWPNSGYPELPDYSLMSTSPGEWTIGRWRRERLQGLLEGVEMVIDVDVADSLTNSISPQTRLSTLRRLHRDGKLWAGTTTI
jgi:hypothetical protein